MDRPRFDRGRNDLIFDDEGRRYIDLFTGHGAAWLGHANARVIQGVARQLDRIWITGGLPTAALENARTAVEGFFPSTHGLACFYSTGMEAAEFSIRLARVATGKSGIVGFERAMHGKSLATAALGWDNPSDPRLPFLHRIPFLHRCGEAEILGQLEAVLAREPIAAVFVEPIHASGGGYAASKGFYGEVRRLCSEHAALLVFDEILTGFHRTGPPFCFSDLALVPDVVLVGKAIGNGFPVSGVVARRDIPARPATLRGSTFSENPLAAAAVSATLEAMRSIDVAASAARIGAVLEDHTRSLDGRGPVLRGRGALWILDFPATVEVERLAHRIYRRGVAIGYTRTQLRVLPAATIETGHLAEACSIIVDEVSRFIADGRSSV